MPDIILTTLNARYIHPAFGLRYLFANLGALQARARLLEFDLDCRPLDVVESLLREEPRIIGVGVYIWNAAPALQVVRLLKQIRPETIVVLGGPEVSYESDRQEIVRLADYLLPGEADLAFADLCDRILDGERPRRELPLPPLPDVDTLQLPYAHYTDEDLAHRTLYVEASRGCPFHCEFCLSSLDDRVRAFPLAPFLAEIKRLLERGARQFKFVDRTFNLRPDQARTILEFFLARPVPGLFLHFEMVPDRFPDALRAVVARFPPGTLQFEVGIQTFNPEVAERIRRRQDYAQLEANLRWLRRGTGVYVHADLIAGLPGESLASFADGFDRLLALDPHEIQVGILKRLRGTPIERHTAEWLMVYSPDPPYEILRNRLLSFDTLQHLRRFARYWDLTVNRGTFPATAPLLWEQAPSPFEAFSGWTEWLFARAGRRHGIALDRLAQWLAAFLETERGIAGGRVLEAITADYQRAGRSLPRALSAPDSNLPPPRRPQTGLQRQRRRTPPP